MSIGNFRDLAVWQRSIELVIDTYRLTITLPIEERYGLAAQIRRAAISIPANMSEGHGRATTGEYLNHLSMARGSLNEVRTLLLICERLGLVAAPQVAPLHESVEVIGKMVWRLRNALNAKNRV